MAATDNRADPMDHQQCYQKLDLKPECSWKELQCCYRHLLQKWHPDRYQRHPDQQHVAAHRLLEINEAYGILAKHYRQHGQLPFEAPRHRAAAHAPGTAAVTPHAEPDPDLDASLECPRQRVARSRLLKLLPWLIAICSLALGYCYLAA